MAGLKLAASTIKGYKKIIRNHIRPQLGAIRLDKLTATRIARHYRDLEDHERKDEYGKGQPLSANSVHNDHHDDEHLLPRHPDNAKVRS